MGKVLPFEKDKKVFQWETQETQTLALHEAIGPAADGMTFTEMCAWVSRLRSRATHPANRR